MIVTTGGNPDYALVPNPASLSIAQGGSATDTIMVVPINGWTSGVALSTTSATTGITASLSVSPVAVNGTSTLTVQVASTVAPGSYSVTVNGMSGSQAGQNNHSITIPVTVTGGGTPDFTLSASPTSLTIAAPGSGTTTITVNPLNGFTGSVALSTSGLPSGVTAAFSPTSTTSTSLLTFSADSTAMAGTYPVTVTVVSGSLTHTTAVSLVVTAGGAIVTGNFYLAAYATSASSIRLYWDAQANTANYQVFRANSSGGYNFNQPLASPNNGTTWFDDSGLQSGNVYYYVVRAIKSDGTYTTSDEDYNIPSPGVIPWNGTAPQILNAAWSIASAYTPPPTQDGSVFYPDPINLRVMSPDGSLYYFDGSGNPVGPMPREVSYNTTTNTLSWPDGSTEAATAYDVSSGGVGGNSLLTSLGGQLLQPAVSGDAASMGVIRRVCTKLNTEIYRYLVPYNQVGALFYLPKFSDNGGVFSPRYLGISPGHVTPHAYVGILGDKGLASQVTVDAGIAFDPAGYPNTGWKNRCGAVLRIADGRAGNGYLNQSAGIRVDAPRSGTKFIDAELPLGSIVAVGLAVPSGTNTVVFDIFASDANGVYYSYTTVGATRLHTPNLRVQIQAPYKTTSYRLKRVVSLDQDEFFVALSSSANYFSNFVDGYGLFKSAIPDGTNFNVNCQSLLTNDGVNWDNWTDDLTDICREANGVLRSPNNVYFYNARWSGGTLLGPVLLNPVYGSSHNENVQIKMP